MNVLQIAKIERARVGDAAHGAHVFAGKGKM